jgi:hypothetical protein
MPGFVIPLIAVIVIAFVVIGVFGAKKSLARAKQTTQDFGDALQQRLGLRRLNDDKALSKLGGQYRGRKVIMLVDSRKVMKASNAAMKKSLLAAGKELAGVGGLAGGLTGMLGGGDGDNDVVSTEDEKDEWEEQRKDQKLRDRVNNAAMVVRWGVMLPADSPVQISIGHDANDGEQIGQGLYATFQEPARAGLSQPQVIGALSKAEFTKVTVNGRKVLATLALPMHEYQKHVTSPEAFTALSESSLTALCTLCDGLYGPAAQA